jgi:hypothetical protein
LFKAVGLLLRSVDEREKAKLFLERSVKMRRHLVTNDGDPALLWTLDDLLKLYEQDGDMASASRIAEQLKHARAQRLEYVEQILPHLIQAENGRQLETQVKKSWTIIFRYSMETTPTLLPGTIIGSVAVRSAGQAVLICVGLHMKQASRTAVRETAESQMMSRRRHSVGGVCQTQKNHATTVAVTYCLRVACRLKANCQSISVIASFNSVDETKSFFLVFLSVWIELTKLRRKPFASSLFRHANKVRRAFCLAAMLSCVARQG